MPSLFWLLHFVRNPLLKFGPGPHLGSPIPPVTRKSLTTARLSTVLPRRSGPIIFFIRCVLGVFLCRPLHPLAQTLHLRLGEKRDTFARIFWSKVDQKTIMPPNQLCILKFKPTHSHCFTSGGNCPYNRPHSRSNISGLKHYETDTDLWFVIGATDLAPDPCIFFSMSGEYLSYKF